MVDLGWRELALPDLIQETLRLTESRPQGISKSQNELRRDSDVPGQRAMTEGSVASSGIEMLESGAVSSFRGDDNRTIRSGKSERDIGENTLHDLEARQERVRHRGSSFSRYHTQLSNSLTTRRAILLTRVDWCYREYILHGVLRRPRISRAKDERHIELDTTRTTPLIDERTGWPYISNRIRSSRYTIWSFLPYQVYFQFNKASNLYFLITASLQLVPGLSTTGRFTSLVPLVVFWALTVLREGYDDFKRYRMDGAENKRRARVLCGVCKGGCVVGKGLHALESHVERMWKTVKKAVIKRDVLEAVSVNITPESSKGGSRNDLVLQASNSPERLWHAIKWTDIKVGDIIELRRDDQVPADIILLYAEGRNGVAYVETMSLDGETNLKQRTPPAQLAERCKKLSSLRSCRARFEIEDPNPDLYSFHGVVNSDGKTAPLTSKNVIYRGSTLRNTRKAIGIVVNTGEESKLRMNANQKPMAKAPAMQSTANWIVFWLAVLVILLTIGCSVGYSIWSRVFERKAWYLNGGHVKSAETIIGFAIQFNNLVPLALYISMEIVKFAQFIMLQDIEMYDPASNTPMVSNTQAIYENLGQIGHIFSDKTGTLTENIMRFRKMSVAGMAWVHTVDLKSTESLRGASKDPALSLDRNTNELGNYLRSNDDDSSRDTQFFLQAMALCHTCFPEIGHNGEIDFQAESPDEFALVKAAKELGYTVVDRAERSLTIRTGDDDSAVEIYEVLDVIEFSPARKRMSIVVKFPGGQICLLCKGADSVMESRLRRHHGQDREMMDICFDDMKRFAEEGLRTLVYGHRFITNEEYTTWKTTFHEATTSLRNRQERIEGAAELIEHSLTLTGATAIEDQLQKGVPETIEKLRRANIKIWMLTGDKRETAINIAHSARICRPDSKVMILHHDAGDIRSRMAQAAAEASTGQHCVLVVDGQTLGEVDNMTGLDDPFYDLLLQVDSVICCRASPAQKASMVIKVRQRGDQSLTLAIGDGGNDISMIKEAHVGVGISGREGLQAARVADYSIAQFRFLQRLLLVHGHWNYIRTAKFILLTFWKEIIFYTVQILYQRWNGYTGTSVFENWFLTFWNTLWSSLCVILPAVFEQDLSATTLLAVPELYRIGQDWRAFNIKVVGWWILTGAIEGTFIWFMVYALYGLVPTVSDQRVYAIGSLAGSVCVLFINIKLL